MKEIYNNDQHYYEKYNKFFEFSLKIEVKKRICIIYKSQ